MIEFLDEDQTWLERFGVTTIVALLVTAIAAICYAYAIVEQVHHLTEALPHG